MLKYMDLLKSYRTYWYITITPYEADIEPGLFKTIVSKRKIIEAFLQISEIVGEEHIAGDTIRFLSMTNILSSIIWNSLRAYLRLYKGIQKIA